MEEERFTSKKGCRLQQFFVRVTTSNPEVTITMYRDQVIFHLKTLLNYYIVTKDMVNNAILERDLVLKCATKHANLPDVCVKDHYIMKKVTVIKKKLTLKHIPTRRRR